MKNDIDDLLNSVFGSRTLRTGGQAAGREKPETPRLTLEPEPKQPSPRGQSPQRRTAPGRPAAPARGAWREDARRKADVPVIDFDAIGNQPPGTDLHAAPDFAAIEAHLRTSPQRDYMASRGEYLNSKLLAAYLGFAFVDAAQMVLFRADGPFDAEATNTAIGHALVSIDRAVIPGFYGAMPDGTIHTFSRGGSDVTGSIVARAVGAELYENWTDVSGVLAADPRIIEHPHVVDYITYRELRELSYMGASVLHEDAVFPVRRANIPINIRNTNRPQDPGTLIVESTCRKPKYTITGIAGKKGFCSINIEKSMMNSEIGFGRKVLQVFEDQGISFEHIPSGIDTLTVYVHQDEFEEKEQQVIAGIHRAVQPDFVEMESDLALIAVVGRGMKSTRGTAGRIFSALAHANVNVKMIDQGSSELNIIIGVKNADFEAAVKAIYDIFITAEL